ncbi:MAG TPA: ATP-binding protein [Burkholderiaceae bacterium]|nr:ATP-binding protein [Burkholderiaceae bacterium]
MRELLGHLPDVRRRPVLVHLGFAAAGVMILCTVLALHDATHRAAETARQVEHTEQVLAVINDADLSLARLESAQRGYLLNGDPALLAEREEWAMRLRDTARRFSTLTSDNPLQQQRASELQRQIGRRLALAEQTSVQPRALRAASAPPTMPKKAREAMQAVVDLAQQARDEELRLLRERRLAEKARQSKTLNLLWLALVMTLALFVPAYRRSLKHWYKPARTERRLRDLAENLPLTVYQMRTLPGGRRHRMEFLSGNAPTLRDVDFNATRDDARHIERAVLPDDLPRLRGAIAHAVQTLQPFEVEFRAWLADGSLRWFRSSAAMRREHDASVLWNGYWVDITEQKQLQQALERARIAADEASRAKSAFLAAMSHEIRTPMNGVLGMLELLALTRLDDEQRATLGVVRESSGTLLRILDDLLDFSKIEAGQLSLVPEAVSVRTMVERSCQIYSGTASSKGLVLQHRIDERVAPALRFDPIRLGQILNNFISNALKFTARGVVTVGVEVLAQRADRQSLRFSVQDTGIGVSPDQQRRLFAPFVQAEGDTARRYGGTGLGLAICKSLAEMMGASIGMSSEPGRGTTMTLTLDLELAHVSELREARLKRQEDDLGATLARRPTPPTVQGAAQQRRLVMVVDDHPINRSLLARQVQALGYACESFDNGFDALRAWGRGRFALVLTDVNMPRMSGYDLARSIRSREAGGSFRTPIVACSANALASELQEFRDSGMDDYVVKPVQLLEVMRMLDRWLPLQEAEAASGPAEAHAGHSPPLDTSMLASLTEGNPTMQRDVLQVFRRTNDDDAQLLRMAVKAGEAPAVRRMAHRIKGASQTMGAQALAEVCDRIETAGRLPDWTHVGEQMSEFESELQRLNAYLDSL